MGQFIFFFKQGQRSHVPAFKPTSIDRNVSLCRLFETSHQAWNQWKRLKIFCWALMRKHPTLAPPASRRRFRRYSSFLARFSGGANKTAAIFELLLLPSFITFPRSYISKVAASAIARSHAAAAEQRADREAVIYTDPLRSNRLNVENNRAGRKLLQCVGCSTVCSRLPDSFYFSFFI